MQKKMFQIILISLIANLFFYNNTLAQIKKNGFDKNNKKDVQVSQNRGGRIPRAGEGSQIPRAGEGSQIPRANGNDSLRITESNHIDRLGLQQTGEATVKTATQFVPSKPAPGPESSVAKANQLTKIGKYQEAISLYNKIIQMRPQLSNARLGLGYTFIQMGEYDKAIEEYQKAISTTSDNAEGYLNLGVAFYGKKNIEQAITSFEKALSIRNGKFAIAHFNLAMASSHQGNYEKAITHYLQSIEQDKALSEACNNLGLVYEALGDKDKALKYFQSAIEQEKGKYPLAQYNLGRFYYNQGEKDLAIEQFQLAIKHKPNFSEAYLDLANLFVFRTISQKTNEYEKAIANYKKAIELNKGFYSLAYENLAIALAKQGKISEALTNYRIAFQQNQGKSPDTVSNLFVTLAEQPIYAINNELSLTDNINNIKYKPPTTTIDERILIELEKFAELGEETRDQVDVRYCMGMAYFAIGKWQEAALEFSKAVELSGGKDKQAQEALTLANKKLKGD